MIPIPLSHCPHCNSALPTGALVCPSCKQLVYRAQLAQLLSEAQRLESVDPALAAATWRQTQALLPTQSLEYHQIGARAAALDAGTLAPAQPGAGPIPFGYARPPEPVETFGSILLKTGGSMALSMYVYSQGRGWQFAVGFVLLILIHELGHVVANWYYGLKQSPPIFIPYMGAVIFLRQNPQNAKAEAVVGIAGPIAGTAGALACYTLALYTGSGLLGLLAMYALLMNLFNMIPCPPLDGGRIAAAISPVLWVPGVALFVLAMFFGNGKNYLVSAMLAFWILRSAVPRILDALKQGTRGAPYYAIGAPARVAVAVSYSLLTALLLTMLLATPLRRVAGLIFGLHR